MDMWIKYGEPVMAFFEKLWWYCGWVEVECCGHDGDERED
jgi:hypothetical protein